MSDETAVILARIEAKLDRVISDSQDHERRLRAVERWMWTALGTGITGAGTGLWALLGG